MLVSLKIENFALIDQLDLELQPGLNVLTGETGAGKSIILDAIDAVLGGKATGRWVRTGTDKALVEAAFQADSRITDWLAEQEIPSRGEVITCRRDLSAGKTVRSKSRLNGVIVKKPQMESLRQLLIEITAQGQTLQLGDPDLQRDWLDGFGDQKLVRQRHQVGKHYTAASAAKKVLDTRRRADQQRADQLEMLQFQNKEFTDAALEDPDELETLQIEHQRLSHSVELQQQSYQVYQILYENDEGAACADMLGDAEGILSDMLRFDPEVNPMLEMVADALAQVQEAGDFGVARCVAVTGEERLVQTLLLESAPMPGQWLLVHIDMAIQPLSSEEAELTNEALLALGGARDAAVPVAPELAAEPAAAEQLSMKNREGVS